MQPANFLPVGLESPLATRVAFQSKMALLFTEKFYNIKSQGEDVHWDPWASQEVARSRCKLTHLYYQNTVGIKGGGFFPREKMYWFVLPQGKLVQVHLLHIIGVWVYLGCHNKIP